MPYIILLPFSFGCFQYSNLSLPSIKFFAHKSDTQVMEQVLPKRLFLVHVVLQIFLACQFSCDPFVKIDSHGSALTNDNIEVTVSFVAKDSSHILVISLYLQSSLGEEKVIAKRNFSIDHGDALITLATNFQIRKRYMYFDSRLPKDPTDYFARNIRVKVCIYHKIIKNCIKELSDELILTLNSPWRREEVQTYCPAWSLKLKTFIHQQHVPKCQDIADTVTLVGTQLVLSGKHDQGFVRKIPPLHWPEHVPSRIVNHLLSRPRFSVEFRIYILEKCRFDFCEILAHRLSLKFLSPILLLNRQGLLHVQFHDMNDVGEAFVTSSPLPLKKWVHVVLTVNGYETQLSFSDEDSGDIYQNYVHRLRGIAFNSDVGIWNIGGYYGFSGFRGIICCVRLHRRKSLKPEQLQDTRKDSQRMHQFDVPKLVEKCRLIRRKYRSVLMKHSNHTAACYSTSFKQHYLKSTVGVTGCRQRLRISKDLTESFLVLERSVKSMDSEKIHKRDFVAKELALRGLSKVFLSTPLALRLFELSGCLGYFQSFLATSLVRYFQSNASSVNESQITSWELYAAMYDDALAQLALSYKHQLGCGGVQQDAGIAAGYAKAAALTVKKSMEDEKQLIHTHSELIRLDEAGLFAGKRGMSSDVMKWLRYQAEWGSMSAQSQMAEILFHGQHGVDAQRNEAVHLYRAGALQGDANSMYNLGVLHLRGIEVEKNETLAIELFRKASKKNYTIAFNSLGYHELVNRKNITGALYYWILASDLGDKDAMTNMGIQYENGVPGVLNADKKKALNFFKKSAEKGQKDGCIRYADYLVSGDAEEKNEVAAIRYYRYVAEQLPTIGLYLRNGFDSYLEGNWNTSLVMYMLVSETGLALASFNTALLCDEMLNYGMDVGSLGSDCSLHFYNFSSILGWPASIIRMGDEYWYGRRITVNQTRATMNYAWVANVQESPQGLFNLGFLIENNYSLNGIKFKDRHSHIRGNLTLARIFYERCQHSKQDQGEGYYPCTVALFYLKIKTLIRSQTISVVLFAVGILAFLVFGFISNDEIY